MAPEGEGTPARLADRFGTAAYGGAGWQPRVVSHRAELGTRWAAAGIASEWAPLRTVLLSQPGPALGQASTSPDAHQLLAPVELALAVGALAEAAGADLVGRVDEALGLVDEDTGAAGDAPGLGLRGPLLRALPAEDLQRLAVLGSEERDRDLRQPDVHLGREDPLADRLDHRSLEGRPVAEPRLDEHLTALRGPAEEHHPVLGRDAEFGALLGRDTDDRIGDLA